MQPVVNSRPEKRAINIEKIAVIVIISIFENLLKCQVADTIYYNINNIVSKILQNNLQIEQIINIDPHFSPKTCKYFTQQPWQIPKAQISRASMFFAFSPLINLLLKLISRTNFNIRFSNYF